jgi:hypothetical protein
VIFHARKIFSTDHCYQGTFLVNNYKQAVEIIDTEEALTYAMSQAGITEEMLKGRLEEEKVYLKTLSKEPQEETDKMEYYQQLVNLGDRKSVSISQCQIILLIATCATTFPSISHLCHLCHHRVPPVPPTTHPMQLWAICATPQQYCLLLVPSVPQPVYHRILCLRSTHATHATCNPPCFLAC